MSDNLSSQAEGPPSSPKPKRFSLLLWTFFLLTLLLGGSGIALRFFLAHPAPQPPFETQPLVQSSVQDGDLLRHVHTLDVRLSAVEAQLAARTPEPEAEAAPGAIAPLAAPVAPASLPKDAVSKEAFSALKEELDQTKSDLKALQDRLAQSNHGAAALVAFVQLKSVCAEGHPFGAELQALRSTLPEEGAAREGLAALAPFAQAGAPTVAALAASFSRLIPDAEAALHKASAKTWKDRLFALLGGLISVRDLKKTDSPEGALKALGDDLDAGRLGAALEKEAGLPDAARLVLQGWRDQALARFNLEAALSRLADDLMGKVKGA